MKTLLTVLLLACACGSLNAQIAGTPTITPLPYISTDGTCPSGMKRTIANDGRVVACELGSGKAHTDTIQDGDTIIVHLSSDETKKLDDAKKKADDAQAAYVALQAKIRDAYEPDRWAEAYCVAEMITGTVPGTTNEVTMQCAGAYVLNTSADFSRKGFAIITRDSNGPLTYASYELKNWLPDDKVKLSAK